MKDVKDEEKVEEKQKFDVFTTDKNENIKFREEFSKTRIGKEIVRMERIGEVECLICFILTVAFNDEFNLWWSCLILVGALFEILTRGLYLIMLNEYAKAKK